MAQKRKIVVGCASQVEIDEIKRALESTSVDYELLCEPSDCKYAPLCRWVSDTGLNRDGRYAGALMDAVKVLEKTRHSFKSKQLGNLRKRLTDVLNNTSEL